MNLYKKCTAKYIIFLVKDTALASDNLSCWKQSFNKNIKTNHEN